MDVYRITTIDNSDVYYDQWNDPNTITYNVYQDYFVVGTKDIKEITEMVYQYRKLHNL